MSAASSSAKAAPSGYQIEHIMATAQALIAGLREEGVDTDEDELMLLLRDASADIERIILRLLRAADEADAQTEGLGSRIAALAERRARFSRRREAYRTTITAIIEALPAVFPEGRYRGAEYTATVRPGTPKPIITDETALPDVCLRITRAPDFAMIRELAKAGTIPGVVLSNATPVLTVRSR